MDHDSSSRPGPKMPQSGNKSPITNRIQNVGQLVRIFYIQNCSAGKHAFHRLAEDRPIFESVEVVDDEKAPTQQIVSQAIDFYIREVPIADLSRVQPRVIEDAIVGQRQMNSVSRVDAGEPPDSLRKVDLGFRPILTPPSRSAKALAAPASASARAIDILEADEMILRCRKQSLGLLGELDSTPQLTRPDIANARHESRATFHSTIIGHIMEAQMNRRNFLSLVALGGSRVRSWTAIREDDPKNTKICHRINARQISDDDLLFLKQIGLRYGRLEFGTGETSFDYLKATQERFAKYDIKILSGVHYAYRSLKVQLGQPGRDKDIETYQQIPARLRQARDSDRLV